MPNIQSKEVVVIETPILIVQCIVINITTLFFVCNFVAGYSIVVVRFEAVCWSSMLSPLALEGSHFYFHITLHKQQFYNLLLLLSFKLPTLHLLLFYLLLLFDHNSTSPPLDPFNILFPYCTSIIIIIHFLLPYRNTSLQFIN